MFLIFVVYPRKRNICSKEIGSSKIGRICEKENRGCIKKTSFPISHYRAVNTSPFLARNIAPARILFAFTSPIFQFLVQNNTIRRDCSALDVLAGCLYCNSNIIQITLPIRYSLVFFYLTYETSRFLYVNFLRKELQ